MASVSKDSVDYKDISSILFGDKGHCIDCKNYIHPGIEFKRFVETSKGFLIMPEFEGSAFPRCSLLNQEVSPFGTCINFT